MLGIVINDLLVHSWDLARAIGVDDTLPGEAVAACLEFVEQVPAEALALVRPLDGRCLPQLREAFDAAMAAHGEASSADVVNFTDIELHRVVGEVTTLWPPPEG